MLSREADKMLNNASIIARKMKDEYVSIEHLLFAILKSKDDVSQLLKSNNIIEKKLSEVINILRKWKM